MQQKILMMMMMMIILIYLVKGIEHMIRVGRMIPIGHTILNLH